MKRKISGAFIVAALIAGGFAVSSLQKPNDLDDMTLRNIEALTQSEVVTLPCVSNALSSCTFIGRTSNGQYGWITISRMSRSN